MNMVFKYPDSLQYSSPVTVGGLPGLPYSTLDSGRLPSGGGAEVRQTAVSRLMSSKSLNWAHATLVH